MTHLLLCTGMISVREWQMCWTSTYPECLSYLVLLYKGLMGNASRSIIWCQVNKSTEQEVQLLALFKELFSASHDIFKNGAHCVRHWKKKRKKKHSSLLKGYRNKMNNILLYNILLYKLFYKYLYLYV